MITTISLDSLSHHRELQTMQYSIIDYFFYFYKNILLYREIQTAARCLTYTKSPLFFFFLLCKYKPKGNYIVTDTVHLKAKALLEINKGTSYQQVQFTRKF